MTVMVIPRILILPVSGFLADRFGIFKILVAGTGLLGFVLVLLFFVSQINVVNETIIIIFAILFGGISAAILPALYSAIPTLASEEHLQKANSLMQFMNQGSLLVGPLLAGIIIEKTSDTAYLFMAFAALIALFLFSKVHYVENKGHENPTKETQAAPQGSFMNLLRLPLLLLLLIFTAILNLCIIGPQQVGFPVIALNYLSDGMDGYTRLLSMIGLGSLIGAVLIGTMKRKPEAQSIYLISGCSFVLGIVWSIFSFRSSELLIMGSIFVAGLLLGIINVLFMTTIQQLTPEFLVGRVMSIQFLCSTGLQPVSYMITGILLDQFNINHLYLISGGTIIFISIIILVYNHHKNNKCMWRIHNA